MRAKKKPQASGMLPATSKQVNRARGALSSLVRNVPSVLSLELSPFELLYFLVVGLAWSAALRSRKGERLGRSGGPGQRRSRGRLSSSLLLRCAAGRLAPRMIVGRHPLPFRHGQANTAPARHRRRLNTTKLSRWAWSTSSRPPPLRLTPNRWVDPLARTGVYWSAHANFSLDRLGDCGSGRWFGAHSVSAARAAVRGGCRGLANHESDGRTILGCRVRGRGD